ncbi:venom acid phosphatase Acph-1-like [Cylas formicarius]|uniref:venom acid phosphatase Acph-1-like n=1 Tax=Cylas formicarius TaxID=197179 RepID=UPI0029584A17|nr:venom acid phosphatase Acph-1-like [Cylas formicarius]
MVKVFLCCLLIVAVSVALLGDLARMNKFVGFFALFAAIFGGSTENPRASDSLRLVTVWFRHGARTPELKDSYPNDPYQEDTFQPEGWGQLTNNGKQMAFDLGKLLRKRYDHYLGDVYTPDLIKATTTDYDRTKMSLLLTLAGLFAPSLSQKWHDTLDWMPIPYDYDKEEHDHILTRPNKYCPVYFNELQRVLASEETVAYLNSHRNTTEYIEQHTGKPMKTLGHGFQIFQTLTAEYTMNLTLPEWTAEVFPDKVTEFAVKQCEMENHNTILKKLNGGRSLQRVIRHMREKAEGIHQPDGRKMYLNSGHEFGVLRLLAALNLYKPHFPNYCAAAIIELHYLEKEQDYAVKVVHVDNVYKEPNELQVPGCDLFCPLNQFIELTKEHVPNNYTQECGSSIYLD